MANEEEKAHLIFIMIKINILTQNEEKEKEYVLDHCVFVRCRHLVDIKM